MCFSATASFSVGTALLATGVVSLKYAKQKSQIPFAAIPFVFSIQQFIEGFLWLSLTKDNYAGMHSSATHAFLAFAEVVWPIWVPLSMWLVEKDVKRKKMLSVLLFLGFIVGACLAFGLSVFDVDSYVSGHHIRYEHSFHNNAVISIYGVLYFMVTVIPPMISSVKRMFFIGLILLLSYIISKLFFKEYVISVWCYFAASISVLIVFISKKFEKLT